MNIHEAIVVIVVVVLLLVVMPLAVIEDQSQYAPPTSAHCRAVVEMVKRDGGYWADVLGPHGNSCGRKFFKVSRMDSDMILFLIGQGY